MASIYSLNIDVACLGDGLFPGAGHLESTVLALNLVACVSVPPSSAFSTWRADDVCLHLSPNTGLCFNTMLLFPLLTVKLN